MTRNKKQPLSKPVMIRMEEGMKQEVEAIAAANDLSASDIIRLAVRRQLPSLKSGGTSFRTARTA
jgi:hypothetical protein